jgi:hypothetical protein
MSGAAALRVQGEDEREAWGRAGFRVDRAAMLAYPGRTGLQAEGGMERPALSEELRDLIHRVAAHPHGLGFLHLAPLESVAVTLGVRPSVAGEARRWLETPEGRARLIAEVGRARREGVQVPLPAAHTVPSRAAASVEEVIERARRHPLGVRFLLRAPLESVAVTLEAHPFLVLRARSALHARAPGDAQANGDAG